MSLYRPTILKNNSKLLLRSLHYERWKKVFFSFKGGLKRQGYNIPPHFLYHFAYFARRTAEVNGVACGAYFSIICQDSNM